MFGLNWIEMLVIVAVVVIGVALIARRNPNVQQKLLDVLPDAGDQALLAIQKQIPGKAELREQLRNALDAAEAKEEVVAKAYLEKRGYTVAKPA